MCDCAIATEVHVPHTAFTAVWFWRLLGLYEDKQTNKQKRKFKPFSSMSPLCVTATVCDCAIATEVRAPHTAFTAVRFRPLLGLREGGGGLLLRSNVVTSAGVSTNLSSRNTWDYFEFSSPFIQLPMWGSWFCTLSRDEGLRLTGGLAMRKLWPHYVKWKFSTFCGLPCTTIRMILDPCTKQKSAFANSNFDFQKNHLD